METSGGSWPPLPKTNVVALRITEAPGKSYYDASPGDMWPCIREAHQIDGCGPCWVVRLPGGGYVWHTNSRATDAGTLWTVTGDAPNITVHPSINIGPEIWHGWITDGTLSPDMDCNGD